MMEILYGHKLRWYHVPVPHRLSSVTDFVFIAIMLEFIILRQIEREGISMSMMRNSARLMFLSLLQIAMTTLVTQDVYLHMLQRN